MNKNSPKPIVARVVRTWCVPPGLKFALVEDIENSLWVVESCPVGTHCWTLAQAEQLASGVRTRRVLEEAVRLGTRMQQAREDRKQVVLPRSVSRAIGRTKQAPRREISDVRVPAADRRRKSARTPARHCVGV